MSDELKRELPGLGFVDGAMWDSTTPPVKDTLSACFSNVVYLWDRLACPHLPHQLLPDGRARGPTSGVVVQYVRPTWRDGILMSGDIGIGYKKTDTAIGEFVKSVWRIVKNMNAGQLECFDKATGETLETGIRDYVVGPGVFELVRNGIALKHCSADVYYRCEQLPRRGKRE